MVERSSARGEPRTATPRSSSNGKKKEQSEKNKGAQKAQRGDAKALQGSGRKAGEGAKGQPNKAAAMTAIPVNAPVLAGSGSAGLLGGAAGVADGLFKSANAFGESISEAGSKLSQSASNWLTPLLGQPRSDETASSPSGRNGASGPASSEHLRGADAGSSGAPQTIANTNRQELNPSSSSGIDKIVNDILNSEKLKPEQKSMLARYIKTYFPGAENQEPHH